MKTINEAALEYLETVEVPDVVNDFEHGVAFAQRWIPVEEQLPPNIKTILVRDNGISPIRSTALYKDGVFYPDFNAISHKDVTHWRYIDFN
jgi:hypothetical protein